MARQGGGEEGKEKGGQREGREAERICVWGKGPWRTRLSTPQGGSGVQLRDAGVPWGAAGLQSAREQANTHVGEPEQAHSGGNPSAMAREESPCVRDRPSGTKCQSQVAKTSPTAAYIQDAPGPLPDACFHPHRLEWGRGLEMSLGLF